MRILDADRVEVETGDMVCLHTGFAQTLLEMDGKPDAAAARTDRAPSSTAATRRLLQWITDSGLAALIADNYAVERIRRPATDGCCAAAAAARALPVQARHPSRRDLVLDAARRLAARARPQPLPAHRAAAAPARRRRLARDAGGDGLR